MNEDKIRTLQLAENIHRWTLGSIVISLLLIFCASMSNDYSQDHTYRIIKSTELASKNDLIRGMYPSYDVQLMRQAYLSYLLIVSSGRVPAEETYQKLNSLNTPEDYERLVVEPFTANNPEPSLNRIKSQADFYQGMQFFLSLLLLLFQFAIANSTFELVRKETSRIPTYDGI